MAVFTLQSVKDGSITLNTHLCNIFITFNKQTFNKQRELQSLGTLSMIKLYSLPPIHLPPVMALYAPNNLSEAVSREFDTSFFIIVI